ncbi:MAG: TIM barrel protein [Treponema sp.]|jgi:hydroxypyruvate isomerase|nr:TIM barrel protein [Treponema sp.]
MEFSICIDSVFNGIDSLEALDAIRDYGFCAYEFWFWKNRELEAMRKKADRLGMSCRGICTSNFKLTRPEDQKEFLEGLEESIIAAKTIGASCLITQGGPDTGARASFQHRSIAAGLKAAATILKGTGVTLLLEPLNRKINHPDAYLESSDEGFELVREADSENVKLLFDIYHQQISEGDVIRRMTANAGLIGHVHCAGNPGRHELDTGELDYPRIFKALKEAGYNGCLGIEYFPAEEPEAGLRRLREACRSL